MSKIPPKVLKERLRYQTPFEEHMAHVYDDLAGGYLDEGGMHQLSQAMGSVIHRNKRLGINPYVENWTPPLKLEP